MPAWLAGTLLRTGPAKFEVGEQRMRHWFDGLAMLHSFTFGGGTVAYANRFLETKAYEAAKGGEIGFSEFATDPCRSLFKRAFTMFKPQLTDNGNVNLVRLGERHVAMTETPIPVEFDARTLTAAGVAWGVPGELTTAHPHLDRKRRRPAQLRRQARPAQPVPVLRRCPGFGRAGGAGVAADEGARLHALLRAHRALVRARRVPIRRQPAAARLLRSPVHRELPLEARARHPVHPDRPKHWGVAWAVRHRGVLRLSSRQRLRRRRRRDLRHLHLRRRGDRRGPLPRPPAGGQADREARADPLQDLAEHRRSRGRAARRGGDRPAANQLRPLQ